MSNAQDMIDEVELSEKEQVDVNITKILKNTKVYDLNNKEDNK